jgi:hypothetical protein
MSAAAAEETSRVFLESDDEIRGQKYVCLSFLTPKKGLLRSKEHFFFSKFLEFYSMDYKVRATETFIMDQLRDLQSALSNVQMEIANSTPETFKAAEMSEKVAKLRERLSQKTAADLDAHVRANMSDFSESRILESYEQYMVVNRQRLEDDFHKANDFQTTLHGLKVRGVYATNEQATARAKALHKKDPYFNVYVADVGEWLPWDPEPDDVQSQEYANDQLNKLMEAYRENAAKKDAFFEEEKRQKLAEAAAAATAAKKATFGQKGAETEAAEVGRALFDGADADLAIARKAAAAAAAVGGAGAASAGSITHA